MGETYVERQWRIKQHKCKTFAGSLESNKPLKDFMVFTQSTKKGISPLTVGFVVCVPDVYSTVSMKFGDGKKQVPITKGHIRTFSHVYNGNKEFKGCITVRDSNKDWKVHTFSVTPTKGHSERGGLITKFYQTKAGGQSAHKSNGLDVAFMISTGQTLKETIWNFDIKKPLQKQPKLQLATHHVYKHAGKYKGSITVKNHQGQTSEPHYFNVIVSKNPNNSCCEKLDSTKFKFQYI